MNTILEIHSSCISCDNCRPICPESAILKVGKAYYIEPFSCTHCNICKQVCPVDCIKEAARVFPETNED